MKKLCIVPFTDKEYPLVLPLTEKYEITAIAPRGIIKQGTDIAYLKNRPPMHIIAHQYSKQAIINSDIVLISDVSQYDSALLSMAQEALSVALTSDKEIWCFLDQSLVSPSQRRSIHHAKKQPICPNSINLEGTAGKLRKIPIPVVIVYELLPKCDGYDILLKLTNELMKAGKRVSTVSEDAYNSIFSQYTAKFWQENYSSEALVLRLNKMFSDLIARDNSEILLVKLPLPIMKYDDEHPFDAGLTSYLVSQSLPDSMAICCSYLGTPLSGFWDSVYDNMRAKFGMETIGVHVSNQIIDQADLQEISKLFVSPTRVHGEIEMLNKQNNVSFYNMLSDSDFYEFFTMLYNELFIYENGVVDV